MKPVETTTQQEQQITNSGLTDSLGLTNSQTVIHQGRTPGGVKIDNVRTGTMPEHREVAGRPWDPKFQSRLRMIYRRQAATGVPAATVINLSPFRLVVNSPLPELKTVIPAAPLPGTAADEFSFHVFEGTAILAIDDGDDSIAPWDIVPRQLADAFPQEYAQWGGVIAIDGFPTKENLEKPETVEALDLARGTMISHLHRLVDEGMAEWMRSGDAGRKNVTELHHAAGRHLHAAGLLDELPAFMLKIRTAAEVAKKCPVCTAVPQNGQSVCACNYVLDPRAAFLAQVIDEESPALERLTREQVEELGISDFVAETADEKPLRLKSGQIKPLSNARYQMAMGAQQEPPAQQPAAL